MHMNQPNVVYVGEDDDCLSLAVAEDLTLFGLNINRLANKLSLLESFFQYFSTQQKSLDVIFLTETFLSAGESLFYNLEGYDALHFSRESRMGGGLVFYIKKDIKVSHEVQKIQCREVQLMIVNLEELNIKICGIYRPPTSNFSNIREFLDLLDNVLENNKNMICIGDINVDLLKPDSVELVNVISSNSFHIVNKIDPDSFTRRGKSSLTIIDHCYTDVPEKILMQLGETGFSDHKFLLIIVSKICNKRLEVKTYYKKFVNYKSAALKLKRNQYSSFEDFHNFLTLTLNQETTVRTKRFKSSYRKPWATQEIENVCREKRKLLKLNREFPLNSFFKIKIKEIVKKLKMLITQAKKCHYSKLFESNLTNAKELWNISKELIFNKKLTQKEDNIMLLMEKNILSDPYEISNTFNQFFTSVGSVAQPVISLNFEFEPRPKYKEILDLFSPTTPSEIKNLICSLQNHKANGVDEVSSEFLKENVVYFSHMLTRFINEALKTGYFPDSLKFAKVKPLYKNGDSKNVSNYRPISILPVLSKLFEKVIKARLLEHLTANNLIHPGQYGFLKASNTTAAASCLINDIVTGINEKEKTACIFVDVKKAFDCLNFEVLEKKLRELGLRGKALNILKSYMENRKQVVVIGEVKSREEKVLSGAAQGSVLGPLLFLIYINDLLYLRLNSTGRLFADDAAFVYRASDYLSLHEMMQQDLVSIESFLLSINLEMSIKKTEFMIFKSTNSSNTGCFETIKFGCNVICKVAKFKYLGLIIDEKLTWKFHVESILSCIAPYVGMLRRIRPFVNEKTSMKLYYAYIHSRLTYCLPVWSSCPLEQKMRLQRLQNKAIKFIKQKPLRTPTSELFDDNLISFLHLCDYEVILFIQKIQMGLLKCDVTLNTYESRTNRTTRQSRFLRQPHFSMAKSQNSLFYRGISLYNTFTSSHLSKNSTSLADFKFSIKKFVRSR